jgi:hypothetical protein
LLELLLLRSGRLWTSLLSLRGRSRFALLALLRLLLEGLEDLELAVLLLIAERGRLRLVFSSSS